VTLILVGTMPSNVRNMVSESGSDGDALRQPLLGVSSMQGNVRIDEAGDSGSGVSIFPQPPLVHEDAQSTKLPFFSSIRQVLVHLLQLYLAVAVTYMLSEYYDVEKWATLADLKKCATVSDLDQYATVRDLGNNYATIADLNATNNDLLETKNKLASQIAIYDYNLQPGDYKISSLNESHGFWQLCDGSLLDRRSYPELFEVLQYTFGSDKHTSSLFGLPRGANSVLGIRSDRHEVGTVIGVEEFNMTLEHMPSHHHYMFSESRDTGSGPGVVREYRDDDDGSNSYSLEGDSNMSEITWGTTSEAGRGVPFSLYQPTIYIGNLFIYAGRP